MILSALQGNKCFSPRSSLQIRKSGNHMQDCAMPFCGFAHFKLHLPGSVSRPGHPAKPHGALRWLPPLHQGGQGSLRRLPTDKHLPRAHMLCLSRSSWPHPALEQPAWGYPGSAMCHAKLGCQPGTQTQSSWIQVQESRIRGCFHSLTLSLLLLWANSSFPVSQASAPQGYSKAHLQLKSTPLPAFCSKPQRRWCCPRVN